MSERVVPAASGKAETISAIYRAVGAPQWARPNLDGLADVLRDLSWLPDGPVRLRWNVSPDLAEVDRRAIENVLTELAEQTADSGRPLSVTVGDDH